MEDKIVIPKSYNYIGAFLTLACNLKCSYCINHFLSSRARYARRTGAEWVKALNRIKTRDDLPITLQGGEPTIHPDFYEIVNGIEAPVDLMTNLQFDIEEFMDKVIVAKINEIVEALNAEKAERCPSIAMSHLLECDKCREKYGIKPKPSVSHSCPFIEDKKVVCISDYMCPDCDEHKSRYKLSTSGIGEEDEAKKQAKKLLHSLYAYKHTVNGYHRGWGTPNEPEYEKEDIKKLAHAIMEKVK